MNKKIVFVLIGIIFLCVLSSSVVCAAENATLQDDSYAPTDSVKSGLDDTSNPDTASIGDFDYDLEKNGGKLSLNRSYAYDGEEDSWYANKGIVIENRNINIEGNNFTVDMKNMACLFNVYNSTVKISNLIIKNTADTAIISSDSNLTTSNVCFLGSDMNDTRGVTLNGGSYNSTCDVFSNLHGDDGSAIFASQCTITITNATFNITHIQKWGAVYVIDSEVKIGNTTFANMSSKYATAIYSLNSMIVLGNCTFMNLFAYETAGAIGVKDFNRMLVLENCRFVNVSSNHNGGAIFADVNGMTGIKKGKVLINGTSFENCSSLFGGAILQLGGSLFIVNSTLTDNYAVINGGALYLSNVDMVAIINSTFKSNCVPAQFEGYNQGGAIYLDKGNLQINNTWFTDNDALEGSDIYMYESGYEISGSYFEGSIHSIFDESAKLSNNTFLGENKLNQTYYIYVYEGNAATIDYNPIFLDESLVNATSFDLRDYGLVSPVKNQGYMGSCWTFGVTGALESAFLKATNTTLLLDISETNIQNSALMYSIYGIDGYQEGGIETVGTSYMLGWLGVTTSEENTYDELGKISPIYDSGIKYHIHNVVILEPRKNVTDNQKFKQALVKYGAIGVSVHNTQTNVTFNETSKASYYYNETFGTGTDHTVTLIGWNDTYSKNNFLITPPGDGAWIIKNSWGTDWADNGYYYISYYDTAFATLKLPVAFIIDNNHNYEKNYQYDIISNIKFIDYENVTSYANIFNSTGKDLIAAVGTYFKEMNNEYIMEIYVNDELVYTQKGNSTFPGFETVKLNRFISLEENDTFTVKITSGRYVPISSSSRQKVPANVTFLIKNGEITDLFYDEAVACLKVYTISDNSQMKINIAGNILKVQYFDEHGLPLANSNVTIEVYGAEYDAVTDKNGNVIYKLNLPVGKHTISVINPVTLKALKVTLNIASRFSNNANIKMYYFDGHTYKVRVKDDTGKFVGKNQIVTVKIGEYAFKVKTDSSGYAKLKIPSKITPGKYTISVTYKGQTVKNKLTVKQVLKTAKTVKVKKTAKKLVLKATLKKGKTALKSKVIKFKVHGKTYKAKTNKRGIAKVTVKKAAIKKLKAGKKYTIKVRYLKDVVKSTLKVRR